MIKKNRANLHPEEKIHFKMYKDGKRWVFTGIATFLLSTSVLGGTAMADSATNAASVDSNISGEQSNGENAVTATTKTSPSIDTTDGEIQRNESSANANDAGSESANTSAASSANASSTAVSASSPASNKTDSTSSTSPVSSAATTTSAASTDSAKESSSSALVATSSAASSAAESASSAAPASSTASVASSAASETANTSNTAPSTPSAAAKPTAKAATFSAVIATAATTQSDITKIVSADKMNAKDKALHDLNSAWQGSDYAASIANDASGLDSATNQYFIDEWMPDKTLQAFILKLLTSDAEKNVSMPDTSKALVDNTYSFSKDLGITDVKELTKDDLKFLRSFVSTKTTGTDLNDQVARTLNSDELFKNLEGIQYATNLIVLDLRSHDNVVVDMSEIQSNLQAVRYLALYGSGVTGKLDLSKMTNLTTIYLERTGISGDLSTLQPLIKGLLLTTVSIGNTVNGDSNWVSGLKGTTFSAGSSIDNSLTTLNLAGNGLTGGITSINKTLTGLTTLYINDNQFTGKLPEFTVKSGLRLNANNNLFASDLPTSYLTNGWDEFKVANNLRLTGDVPLWYAVTDDTVANENDDYHAVLPSTVSTSFHDKVVDGYDISGNQFTGSPIAASYIDAKLPDDFDYSKIIQKVNVTYDTLNYTINDGKLDLNMSDLVSLGGSYIYLDGQKYLMTGESYTSGTAGSSKIYQFVVPGTLHSFVTTTTNTGQEIHVDSHSVVQMNTSDSSFDATPSVDGKVTATFEDGSTKDFDASDILTFSSLQNTDGTIATSPTYTVDLKKLFGEDYSPDAKAILSFKLDFNPTHNTVLTTYDDDVIAYKPITKTANSGLNYQANINLGINATSLDGVSAGQEVANTYTPVIKNSDGTTTVIGSDITISGQTGLDVPTTQLQDITYNGKTYHAKVGTNVVKNSDGSYGLAGTFGENDSRINIEYVAVGNVVVHNQVQHPDGSVTDMPSDASETVDESAHNVGDSVSVTAKTFDGYKLVGANTATVTLTDGDQDVTFTYTNTTEQTTAGEDTGSTDGENGKTTDVSDKSQEYQDAYNKANQAALRDYSAGQTAGYADGVNGKSEGATHPDSDVTNSTAWQNGYKETTKGFPAGKASYDADKATGTTAGNADGVAGKTKADTSGKSQGYQDGYSDGYTTGKDAYDADVLKGQGLADKDVLGGATKATDHSTDSQGIQDGYTKQFSVDQDVKRLGTHDGEQDVLAGKTVAAPGDHDGTYTGDQKSIYDNAYAGSFKTATSDLASGKQAALSDVTTEKSEGTSVTVDSSAAFKKGYTDTYATASDDYVAGKNDGRSDGIAEKANDPAAKDGSATYKDVYDAGYAKGYVKGQTIKTDTDKGASDADSDFIDGKSTGKTKDPNGSSDYNDAYAAETKKNESDYATGKTDALTDLDSDSKEGTSKKADQSDAYNDGYTSTWQDGQNVQNSGHGDGYKDGFANDDTKSNHKSDQGDFQHSYDTGYNSGFDEGKADSKVDYNKGKSDADKDFVNGKTTGASKDSNGSEAYQKGYTDEAAKNANDFAAGKADGKSDGTTGKEKDPKANQSDAYNDGYEVGYTEGKADHDKSTTGDNGNSGSQTETGTTTTTDSSKTDDGKVDTNSPDYQSGESAGKSDGESGKPHADNSGKSKDYQAGYDNSYNTSKNQHDTDYVSGQNAGIKDGAAGKTHANNLNKSVGYQAGYDSTYSKAKSIYDKNFKDGKSDGENDKKSGKLHADNKGKSKDYQAGYDTGYNSSEDSTEFKTKNLANAASTSNDKRGVTKSSSDSTNKSGSDLPQTGEGQNGTVLAATGLLGLLVALGSFNFKKWFKRE